MSYCASTHSLSAIVLGFCDHQATKLIELLRRTTTALTSPMLLPVLWLNVLGETRAHRVIGRMIALNRTEVELGLHWGVLPPARKLQNMDFDTVTRRLTVYGSEVAWDIHAIEAQQEMLRLIETIHGEIQGAEGVEVGASDLAVRVRHIRQVLSGLMHRTRYTQNRVQIQLQTGSRNRPRRRTAADQKRHANKRLATGFQPHLAEG